MYDEVSKYCKNRSDTAYKIDQVYTRGMGILCTAKCPCKVNKYDWPESVRDSIITDSLGATVLEDCPQGDLT